MRGNTTSADNLAPPCKHHHNGKDADRGFTLHRAEDGTYTWTTPLGYTYTWRPEPHWHPTTDNLPNELAQAVRDATRRSHRAHDDTRVDPADALPDVPICDCPDTCPCQHGPDTTDNPNDQLPPLTIDGDWADGFTTSEGTGAGTRIHTSSTTTTATTATTDTADSDPPPF